VYHKEDFDELLTRGLGLHEVLIDKALMGNIELELLR
jgi:hypothetical protein